MGHTKFFDRSFVLALGRWQRLVVAFVVDVVGGFEFGRRFSGLGHIDVGWLDDVASNQRPFVVAAFGRDFKYQHFGGVGMRLFGFVAIVLH